MALKIDASSLLEKRYLIVEAEGIKFYQGALASSVRRFRFGDVVCVLMSADHVLSFQVGTEVFSLKVKPGDKKHQDVISALLYAVQRANGREPT